MNEFLQVCLILIAAGELVVFDRAWETTPVPTVDGLTPVNRKIVDMALRQA